MTYKYQQLILCRETWSRILILAGAIGMLVGALDPLEGAALVLPGTGLVTFGTWLGNRERGLLIYWIWIFIMVLAGVAAMFVLSNLGGIGGRTGLSMWWALLLVPYPVGWVMGIVSLLFRLIRSVRHRNAGRDGH